jgi:hypothetical protein
MAARIFLGASALLWIPYGIYCFLRPEALAEAAGVSFGTPTGSTEIRATYGGLTLALGALAALGALSPSWTRHALVTLGVACAGFGLARVAGVVTDGVHRAGARPRVRHRCAHGPVPRARPRAAARLACATR